MTVPSRKKATSIPRVGLTREPRSVPSDVRTAFLKESINAVTWGSVQIVEMAGRPVVPGAGVSAPPGCGVVCGRMNNVAVTSGVGVGVATGRLQAASRKNPMKNVARVLVFIVISSLYRLSQACFTCETLFLKGFVSRYSINNGALCNYYIPGEKRKTSDTRFPALRSFAEATCRLKTGYLTTP
jgi:hypothetical protein